MTLDVWRCIVLQGVPAFREPDLRWWQRRRVAPADAASSAELRHLERQLTVEQVSHFRWAATDLGSPAVLLLPSGKSVCTPHHSLLVTAAAQLSWLSAAAMCGIPLDI